MTRIVLCYPVEPLHLRRIEQAAPDCEIVSAGQERIADEILNADLFCGHAKVPVPWDEVVAQGRLQWIQSSAAGLDHCLVPSVIDSTIPVTSASGLFADQVAEQTLALTYGLFRQLPRFYQQQQRHEFDRRPTWVLHGKTIGIVGLGGNGRRIAELLAPLGNRMLAVDWYPEDQPANIESLWGIDQLEHLLSLSDVVILGVPLNEFTHHLFDATRLSRMKRGAVLINVARGPVVDEAALISALQSGHLAGAAVDVTEVEPLDPASPLWDLPNVLITPHVGAQSQTRVDDSTKLFCVNLARRREGLPVWNLVDKRLGFPAPQVRVPSLAALRAEYKARFPSL